MVRRYLSIWFPHLNTDWFSLRRPHLRDVPFVLRTPSHGRMIITSANAIAKKKDITIGMPLADARAFVPDLEVLDDIPHLAVRLLKRLAEWCIRFTPVVAIDPPEGLLLDVTGCPHLWGGDQHYLADIARKLKDRGYDVRVAIADTAGAAWGVARFGKGSRIVRGGRHIEALMDLPPEALRLDAEVVKRLHKLGLHQIRQFLAMPRSSLRRRFGQHFIMRLDMALGQEMEMLQPVQPIEPYLERLPCLDSIVTAIGIEMALRKLLEALCLRLHKEQKGLRTAIFKGYRVDGKVEQLEIGTHRPSNNVNHLFKLFETKLSSIEPALGIELFTLETPKVEDNIPSQEKIWEGSGGLDDVRLSELIDRLANKVGMCAIHRYLPAEHYWPERSIKLASSLHEKPNMLAGDRPSPAHGSSTIWPLDKLRPLHLLKKPEPIEVTAPIPDYPPMLFRYKGKAHTIVKADGPERIEQEWWIQQGQHRDYYRVEDDEGHRYWLFRLGHYHDKTWQWFIHGFFA